MKYVASITLHFYQPYRRALDMTMIKQNGTSPFWWASKKLFNFCNQEIQIKTWTINYIAPWIQWASQDHPIFHQQG